MPTRTRRRRQCKVKRKAAVNTNSWQILSESAKFSDFSFLFLFLFETRSVFTSHLSFLTLTTAQRHFCNKNATAKLKKVNEPVPFVLSLMYCKILCKILSQQDRLTITCELTPRKIESTVFNFIINEQVPKSIWVLIGYWVTDILKRPKASNTFR